MPTVTVTFPRSDQRQVSQVVSIPVHAKITGMTVSDGSTFNSAKASWEYVGAGSGKTTDIKVACWGGVARPTPDGLDYDYMTKTQTIYTDYPDTQYSTCPDSNSFYGNADIYDGQLTKIACAHVGSVWRATFQGTVRAYTYDYVVTITYTDLTPGVVFPTTGDVVAGQKTIEVSGAVETPTYTVTAAESFYDFVANNSSRLNIAYGGVLDIHQNWYMTGRDYGGTQEFIFRSPIMGDNLSRVFTFNYTIPAGALNAKVAFDYSTSTEVNDKLNVYLNNAVILTKSGQIDWTAFSQALTSGSTHAFKFEYVKNASAVGGADRVSVRYLVVTYDLPSAPDALRYEIQLSTDGGTSWASIGTTAAGVKLLGYNFATKANTQNAKLRARAWDGDTTYTPYATGGTFAIRNRVKIGTVKLAVGAGIVVLPVYDPNFDMGGKSQLRINTPLGTGCFELVAIGDATASKLFIQTATGIKAVAKI